MTQYFYLYDQPSFLGIPAPWHFIIFCLGTFFGYLACVFIIWPATRPTTKSAVLFWDKIRSYHNLALCIYSTACCAFAVYDMQRDGILSPFLRFFVEWRMELLEPMLCQPVSRGLQLVNYTFVASKIWEMLDTMWLVWLTTPEAKAILKEERSKNKPPAAVEAKKSDTRTTATNRTSISADSAKKPQKNNVSLLGLIHHSTTTWLFILVTNFEGTLRLGLVLNGAVHSMMYSHYYKAWPKPLVPFITGSQILQLAFVTACWGWEVQRCPQHGNFAQDHFYEFLTPYFMVPVFLLLFIKFFVERFILGKGKQD